jgi:hypothetical protein
MEDLNETEEWFTFWQAGEEQESIRTDEPPTLGDSVGPL